MPHRTAIAFGFVALALAAPVGARRGRAGRPVTTTVTWTDHDGVTGDVPFQGTVRGRTVRGIIQPKSGELWVDASIADDGGVSGTIKTATGDSVGTFDGRLDDGGKLRGSYTVPGGDSGAIAAPANALRGRARDGATPGSGGSD